MYEKKCCVPSCLRTRADNFILHSFPNPKRELERFNKWLYAIGGNLYVLDQLNIFKYGRVCHSHFEQKYYTGSKRLSPNAIPTLGLSGITLPTRPSSQEVDKSSRTTLPDVLTSGNSDNFKLTPKMPIEEIASTLRASQEVLHKFPSPVKDFEHFNTWKITIGEHTFKGLSDEHITKYRRVCRAHFKHKYLCRSNRISANAIPTINVPAIPTDKSTSKTKKEVERPFADCESVPVDNSATAPIEMIKPTDNCEVAPTNSATNIYTNEVTVDVVSDYEGSNDCYEPITESEKPYDSIDHFLIIPSETEAVIRTTEQRRNNDRIDTAPVVPSKITCDNCKKLIMGLRYKCLSCVNYNHCLKCEMRITHTNHYMIRLPKVPEFDVPETIIDEMCDKFKGSSYAIISSAKDTRTHESTLRDNCSVNVSPKVCDSDADLSEGVKMLVRKVVSGVVKNKFKDKVKRKMVMPDDTSKKRNMAIPTTTINDEATTLFDILQNDNVSVLEIVNNTNTSVDRDKETNNESMPMIPTDVTYPQKDAEQHFIVNNRIDERQ